MHATHALEAGTEPDDGLHVPQPLTRLGKIDTSRLAHGVRPRVKPRGLPPALEPHLVWEAHGTREVERLAREVLGPHRLTVTDDPGHEFSASYHAVRMRDLTFGYLDFGAAVHVDAWDLPPTYVVMAPMSGASRVTVDGVTVDATPIAAVLPRPGGRMQLDCERQSPHLIVRIEAGALLVHLGRVLGRALDRPLRFDSLFDLTSPSASRWNFAVQVVHAELLDAESLLHDGVGMGQLEEFVMSSLVYAHSSNYSSFLTRPGQRGEHRAARAAKDFIEMHLAERFTVGDIAEAAGVSERTLQAAFRSELSTTPMAYVKDRRLERARADLADAAPADYVSVTAIATRWGFGHLGRFATEYRDRFGESPSHTLRG